VTRWKKKKNESEKYRNGFVAFSEDAAKDVLNMSNLPDKKTGRSKRAKAIVQAWESLDPKIRKKWVFFHSLDQGLELAPILFKNF
jgi:hypothetical protein